MQATTVDSEPQPIDNSYLLLDVSFPTRNARHLVEVDVVKIPANPSEQCALQTLTIRINSGEFSHSSLNLPHETLEEKFMLHYNLQYFCFVNLPGNDGMTAQSISPLTSTPSNIRPFDIKYRIDTSVLDDLLGTSSSSSSPSSSSPSSSSSSSSKE